MIKTHTLRKKGMQLRRMLLVFCFSLLFVSSLVAQNVSVHLTKGDQTVLLKEQASTSFSPGEFSNATITINEQNTEQTIDGFGFMMTQGSAQVLNDLNPTLQESILKEMFDPNFPGSKISVVRISIGASDLSNSVYFYNDTPGDVAMNNFSLEGPDKEHLIPILKKIIALNPNIKILATPWSAPLWMKTKRKQPLKNPAKGGKLDPQYYEAYARYFVKYLEEMRNEGIEIWGITPQNEPENPFNEPSMTMTAPEQIDFINNHLGPQITTSGFSPKIIAYDHNCDNTNFPIDVVNNTKDYIDGAAFHLYDSPPNIEAMRVVHDATNKNVYFTEQYTGTEGSFDGDFGWHMENVVIGSLRNWSKTVLEWNYAADPDSNPRTPGGCTDCLGAITVNSANSITRNVSYYIISQISKFVRPGAVRLASNDEAGDTVTNVALRNEDGETVLLVYNINSADQEIGINWNGSSFKYNLPGRSAATFTWKDDFTPQAPSAPTNVVATAGDSNVVLSWGPANNASSYSVKRAIDPNGPFEPLVTNLPTTTTTYTNTGLTNGTTYYYIISATNEVGTTESAQISAVPNNITIQSGGVYIIRNSSSNKVMDVTKASRRNGARIQQWEYTGSDHQSWVLERIIDYVYKITAVHSSKAMDLVNGSLSDGTEIQQYTDFPGNENQQWKIVPVQGGLFEIESVRSGKLLEIPNGTVDNANVVQRTRDGSPQQKWALELAPIASNLKSNQVSSRLSDLGSQEDFIIYSNQTEGDMLYINAAINQETNLDVVVFDTLGKQVAKFKNISKADGPVKINLNNKLDSLAPGVYIIKVGYMEAKSFIWQ